MSHIKCTPQPPILYVRAACPQCGAETEVEAETACKAMQGMDGDYHCAGGENEDGDGYLLFPTAESLIEIDRWYGHHAECHGRCVAIQQLGNTNAKA